MRWLFWALLFFGVVNCIHAATDWRLLGDVPDLVSGIIGGLCLVGAATLWIDRH